MPQGSGALSRCPRAQPEGSEAAVLSRGVCPTLMQGCLVVWRHMVVITREAEALLPNGGDGPEALPDVGQPSTGKSFLAQNVNSAGAETPWFDGRQI